MEKFSTLTAIAAPLLRSNVNTDMMTPSETGRSTAVDLGKMLFLHWRYDESGKEKPDFVLNRAPFRNAGILIAGENFGCGSSRERAVWALHRDRAELQRYLPGERIPERVAASRAPRARSHRPRRRDGDRCRPSPDR
jgi:hypothetical protein